LESRNIQLGKNCGLSLIRVHLIHYLKMQTVLPDFVDSHIHFVDGGLGLMQVDLSGVKILEELKLTLTKGTDATLHGFMKPTIIQR